ncbi:unnamed protein product (mitochondrion) [Plasmodiophora brassicae]|uniref:EF-hand domain-containing protein n=1 Tax=Plasmodiophora brassicae TaxID=37360 RepID=A0A0G4INJ2_PLABS|nr:hypothetical protein PBRA_005339 [Plasmodiophora brassicae]SPQ95395.1 unnamed protein product [Plasmodiophora brassicae]
MVGASGSHRAALPGMANAMALLARHEPSFARKYKHLDATDLMEVTTLFGLFDASASGSITIDDLYRLLSQNLGMTSLNDVQELRDLLAMVAKSSCHDVVSYTDYIRLFAWHSMAAKHIEDGKEARAAVAVLTESSLDSINLKSVKKAIHLASHAATTQLGGPAEDIVQLVDLIALRPSARDTAAPTRTRPNKVDFAKWQADLLR